MAIVLVTSFGMVWRFLSFLSVRQSFLPFPMNIQLGPKDNDSTRKLYTGTDFQGILVSDGCGSVTRIVSDAAFKMKDEVDCAVKDIYIRIVCFTVFKRNIELSNRGWTSNRGTKDTNAPALLKKTELLTNCTGQNLFPFGFPFLRQKSEQTI